MAAVATAFPACYLARGNNRVDPENIVSSCNHKGILLPHL
jgi:hypothetical protein